MHPEILLFDEVTAALDPEMVREVLDVMLDLAREGKTMVIVTTRYSLPGQLPAGCCFWTMAVLWRKRPPADFFDHPQTRTCTALSLRTFTL